MTRVDQVRQLLAQCNRDQREAIFRQLREEFGIHPLEEQLHAKAEIILEAIARAGRLTLRMIRGVIAEAAFDVEVVERLARWQKSERVGDQAYDFLLADGSGPVRVQVKLQRSKQDRPMRGNEAPRGCAFPSNMYVVETQKTRAGTRKSTGDATRPYRFGEFDILAVSMYPSAGRWDAFLYTVAAWLLPDPTRPTDLLKYQPLPPAPNEYWTEDFLTAVEWFRSGQRKVIGRG